MKNIKTILIFLFVFYCNFLLAQSDTSLTLSEVMFKPASGSTNSEFVEIYNTSLTDSFNLIGYKIKYYTSTPEIIIAVTGDSIIKPGQLAVVFENDYDLLNGIYKDIIPAGALVLKIQDATFGGGMTNDSDRPIYLINPANDTLDVYTYSGNNNYGISDEKIILNKDNSSTNWGNSLIINGTPGKINSLTPLNYDLAFGKIYHQPEIPIVGDTVHTFISVLNLGAKQADTFTVNIFNDFNNDSIPDISELIFNEDYYSLQSGDSNIVEVVYQDVTLGTYNIIGKIIFAQDEDTLNNISFYNYDVCNQSENYNDIVINEIMYAPATDRPEWVELYNRSSNSINLKDWYITDLVSQVKITTTDCVVDSGQFIVISKDTSIVNYYPISSKVVITNIPALNNTGDLVRIKNSIGVVIDSVQYLPSWGGSIGNKSLERIDVNYESNVSTNWGTSINPLGATPGMKNSITQKDFDIAVREIAIQPTLPEKDDTINISVNIKNIGKNTANNYNVKLFYDENYDNIGQSNEIIFNNDYTNLLSNDSNIVETQLFNVDTGSYNLIGKVYFAQDEDTTNNKLFCQFYVNPKSENFNDIVINEIMYSPKTNEPEWIEIYNRSDKTINLKNWKISDRTSTGIIKTTDLIISPKEYVILSDDSSIVNFYPITSKIIPMNLPSLNNTDDKLTLKNNLDKIIDTVSYYSNWGGGSGKSLERIDVFGLSNDKNNWGTSVNTLGATPGMKNSLTPKDNDLAIKSINILLPTPEQGDTIGVVVKIKNTGLYIANNYNLKIYNDFNFDSVGQVSEIILNNDYTNLLVGDSNLITTALFNVDTGYYHLIAKVNFTQDEDTTNNKLFYQFYVNPKSENFNDIVINEIMYSPKTNEPEWIEIYNRSDKTINLKNWKVSDRTSSGTINTTDLIVLPDEYVILSDDSSVVNFYPITSKIIPMNLPSLNNTDDKLTLKNNLDKIIDTVTYYSNWGGGSGKSLERIDVFGLSNDKNNWGTSVNPLGATPGIINSITQKDYDVKVENVRLNPEFPIFGDNVNIIADIKNIGKNTNSFYIKLYEDTNHDTLKDNLLETSTLRNLGTNDSLSFQFNATISDIQSKKSFIIVVDATTDDDTSNNILWSSVEPGYAKNTILINEVMYDPLTGQTEWIEFVNNSDKIINLENWMVSDVLTSPSLKIISSIALQINPNEYFVIASDTSSFNYKLNTGVKFFEVKFGSLGNSEDGIIITDFRGNVVDSMFYNSSWGGQKGFSLERVSLSAPTLEQSNWRSSIDSVGCTPGKQNSVSNISSYEFQNAVINEIMYEPNTDNSEFIEIYNRSTDAIEIGGWYLEYEDASKITVSDFNFTLQPDKFFVVAADSSILKYYPWLNSFNALHIKNSSSLSLTNSGRLVLLKDITGKTIDSLFYLTSWHNPNINITRNKSLERINPNLNSNDGMNWSTSVSPYNATPGDKNSIFTVNLLSSSNFNVSPNPFSPDNDGFEDFTVINYNLNQTLAQIRIKVYDSKGRLMRTIVNNQPSGSQGSIIFDGLDDDANPLKIGIYILFIEAVNATSGTTDTFKLPVVVARKLN